MKIIIAVLFSILIVPLVVILTKFFLIMLRPNGTQSHQSGKPKKKDCPTQTDPKVSHILRRDKIPNIVERDCYSQGNDRPANNNYPSASTKHKTIIERSKKGVNRNRAEPSPSGENYQLWWSWGDNRQNFQTCLRSHFLAIIVKIYLGGQIFIIPVKKSNDSNVSSLSLSLTVTDVLEVPIP